MCKWVGCDWEWLPSEMKYWMVNISRFVLWCSSFYIYNILRICCAKIPLLTLQKQSPYFAVVCRRAGGNQKNGRTYEFRQLNEVGARQLLWMQYYTSLKMLFSIHFWQRSKLFVGLCVCLCAILLSFTAVWAKHNTYFAKGYK